MKIISIKKAGPELWKIKYKTLFGFKERFVIQNEEINITLPFTFRDNGDYVHDIAGQCQLKWMIKNNISEYDETTLILTQEQDNKE